MADADLNAVRRAFAELTGLFEDAAQIASEGQGVGSFEGGRRCFSSVTLVMLRIRKRLVILEGHLQ